MIPDEGRDVQCSNCGHTWFELPEPSAKETAPATETVFAESDFDEEDVFDAPPPYDLDDDDSFDDEPPAEDTRPKTTPEFLSRAEFEDDDDLPDEETTLWDDEPSEPEPEISDDERTSAAVEAVTSAARDTESAKPAPAAEEDTGNDEDGSWDDFDENRSEDRSDDDASDRDADDNHLGPIVAAAGRQRRPADAAALDILREEAQRELSQRKAAESRALEMQPDLGLGDIRNRRTPSRALRARMAHLGEEAPDDFEEDTFPEVAAPDPKKTRLAGPSDRREDDDDGYEEPKRDLLPDIDEINSTLRRPSGSPNDPETARRSGFRVGFLLMIFVVAAAIFTYAQAPAIARALPDTEAAIISYVDWANGVRDWIDSLISG
jgi:hypothetical protein